MGFMKGRAAVRRTVQFLEKGDIFLRSSVKVVSFQFNTNEHYKEYHDGLSKFVFWHLPQLKYKNPQVQFVTFNNLTPSPWVQAYLDNNQEILIDCYAQNRSDIYNHVKLMLGKTQQELEKEASKNISLSANPANFGHTFPRQCICEVPGHVPCPGWQPLPKEMTGKYQMKLKQEQAEKA